MKMRIPIGPSTSLERIQGSALITGFNHTHKIQQIS